LASIAASCVATSAQATPEPGSEPVKARGDVALKFSMRWIYGRQASGEDHAVVKCHQRMRRLGFGDEEVADFERAQNRVLVQLDVAVGTGRQEATANVERFGVGPLRAIEIVLRKCKAPTLSRGEARSRWNSTSAGPGPQLTRSTG